MKPPLPIRKDTLRLCNADKDPLGDVFKDRDTGKQKKFINYIIIVTVIIDIEKVIIIIIIFHFAVN